MILFDPPGTWGWVVLADVRGLPAVCSQLSKGRRKWAHWRCETVSVAILEKFLAGDTERRTTEEQRGRSGYGWPAYFAAFRIEKIVTFAMLERAESCP